MISHISYFIGFCFPDPFSVSQWESAVKLLNRKSYKAPFSVLSLCLLDSFPHILVPSTREERRREELRRHTFIKILRHPCFKVCCIPDITVFVTFFIFKATSNKNQIVDQFINNSNTLWIDINYSAPSLVYISQLCATLLYAAKILLQRM